MIIQPIYRCKPIYHRLVVGDLVDVTLVEENKKLIVKTKWKKVVVNVLVTYWLFCPNEC
jgi:hypothetical protein